MSDFGLNCPQPLARTNLTELRVMGGTERLSGCIGTSNYVFTFAADGGISRIAKTFTPKNIRQFQTELALKHSDIDGAGAYHLATQWLGQLGVDLQVLNSRYRYTIQNPELEKPISIKPDSRHQKRSRLVPDFWIQWKELAPTAERAQWPYGVMAEVLGPGRELVELEIEDRSLVRFPRALLGPATQLGLMELPNWPFTNLWSHPELNASNIFMLLRTSVAYQRQMLHRMVAECNCCMEELDFPPESKIRGSEITDSFIAPPICGFQGCIATKGMLFQFDQRGKLTYFFNDTQRASLEGAGASDYTQYTRTHPMLLDSNSVVRVARSWARRLQFGLEDLDKRGSIVVSRYNSTDKVDPRLYDFWWVSWWDSRSNQSLLLFVVDGRSKRPSRMKLYDSKFSLRSGIGITNAPALLSVPDDVPQVDVLRPHLNVYPKQGKDQR